MLENKALVQIKVPAIGEIFDVYIPLDCTMYKVNELIKKSIEFLTKDRYIPDSTTCLVDEHSGTIFNMNGCIADLGIKNGTNLILM